MSGGLGNQLFQSAFAHYLFKCRQRKVLLEKLKLKTELQHTRQSFFDSDFFCEHCVYRIDKGWELWNKIKNPWDRKIPDFHNRIIDWRTTPFLGPNRIDSTDQQAIFVGYFQNIGFVTPVSDLMLDHIRIVLSGNRVRDFIRREFRSRNYEVIHVRQGDTKSPTNKARVGILASEYFRRLLSRRHPNASRLVVTDDLDGARQTLDGIDLDYYIGPDDVNPWEALYIMSQANILVTANSTFSWWGGFLAFSLGGKVIIPKPFFASPELNPGDSLLYPGFSESSARYVDL